MTTERITMYTGGSSDAIAFLEKYKKAELVVDFYSEEHINSLNQSATHYSVEDLKDFDSSYGTAYRGHMLAIYIGHEDEEMLNELSDIYPPFKQLFSLSGHSDSGLHKPDFLLLNLATKEILCVGLGRKNREFHYELHKYLQRKNGESTDCSEKFFELDHYEIAERTITETESFGLNLYEFDNLPGNADFFVVKNDSDGLYYLEDFDEDGMTEEEVAQLESSYAQCIEGMDESISLLREIFPEVDDSELSTGDY
jgi:hypothetical protein